jgi:hypothetical protein
MTTSDRAARTMPGGCLGLDPAEQVADALDADVGGQERHG